MAIDYEKMDAELDDEIASMYENSDSSEEADTASTSEPEEIQNTDEQQEDEDTTEVVSSTTEVEDDRQESGEPMVPEHRYRGAVRAMNEAQRELAERRKLDESRDMLIQNLQAEIEALKSNQTQSSKSENTESKAPVSDEESFKEALEYYPEIAKPFLDRIKFLESKLLSMEGDVGSVKTVAQRYQQSEAERAQQAHYNAILQAHPDAREIVNSEVYHQWVQGQAPVIQYALQEGSAQDVIAALNLFKMNHQPRQQAQQPQAQKPKSSSKLEAAREAAAPSVKSGTKPASSQKFTLEQVEKMPMSEFKKYESQIDEMIAKGELV